MMHRAIIPFIAVSTLFVESVPAFSKTSLLKKSLVSKSSSEATSSLNLFAEDEARHRMQKARECAFSDDTCSVEESRKHLKDILYIQSGCASGLIAGSEVCENQDTAAEIVARLREIVGSTNSMAKSVPITTGNAMANGMMSTAALVIFLIMAVSTMKLNQEVIPFTSEEWVWAAKDGYLDDMIAHYIRNAGL